MGYNLLSCFHLKQIVLRNDQHLYCMWITREVDCLVRDNSMASPADPRNKNQQVHTYTCTCMYFTAQKGEGRVSGRVSSHLVIPTSVFYFFIIFFDFTVYFFGGVGGWGLKHSLSMLKVIFGTRNEIRTCTNCPGNIYSSSIQVLCDGSSAENSKLFLSFFFLHT